MRKLAILIIIPLFIVISFLWFRNGISPVSSIDKTPQIFVVQKGEGVREISSRLKQQGFIKDPIVFFLLIGKVGLGIDNKIQAGDHRIARSMTAQEVAKSLTLATNDVWVTIPEGFRAQEIADILEKNVPGYKNSWKDILEKNEGYLFPDTYLIPKTSDVNLVLSILKNNFEKKYNGIDSKNSNFSKEELVTIASLIEREARFREDRPLVASIIVNRLNNGIKLDIDATVQYVLGYQENEKRWWKKNLTFEDLKVNSPYNTYRIRGLPPTPISNPGVAALNAALNPAQTNYLYYISDKEGKNHYAETFEAHNANIKKYGL